MPPTRARRAVADARRPRRRRSRPDRAASTTASSRSVVTDDGTLTVTAAGRHDRGRRPARRRRRRRRHLQLRTAAGRHARRSADVGRRPVRRDGAAPGRPRDRPPVSLAGGSGGEPDLRSGAADEVDVAVTTGSSSGSAIRSSDSRSTYDNQAIDHRLRLHVPLPEPADRSFAEGQFAIVERGLDGRGRPRRVPAADPARRRLRRRRRRRPSWLATSSSTSWSTTDASSPITLLRATGLISRDDHP